MNAIFLDVKCKGGLGNQLFQYAAARSFCVKRKIPFLLLDISEYEKGDSLRTFALSGYSIKAQILHSDFIRNITTPGTKVNRLFKTLRLYNPISENEFVLQDIVSKSRFLLSLNGFWQSEYYFQNIRYILLKELQPVTHPPFPNWIYKENTIAVHIRRTDYLNDERYGFIGLRYYKTAIEYLKEKIHEPMFIIFSDDMEWCKNNIAGNDALYFQDANWASDYHELFLMSKCKHQVIANSSFSWWAAWLNQNVNKIVIRPARPFIDKSLCYENHYPSEWIAVDG